MGKFRVEHAAVANIGKGQKRLGVDAKKTEAYISKHASLSWNEAGLINHLSSGHDTVTTESTDFFTTLNNPVSANGAEAFESAAAYYEATDEEAARKLDKTFPTAEELDPYLLLGAPQTAPQITASVAKVSRCP